MSKVSGLNQAVLSLMAILFLVGCVPPKTRYQSSVDAISAPDNIQRNKYVMMSAVKGVTVDDLQFQEYGRYLEKALAQRGFIKVEAIQDAELVIFVDYGIGEPKEHHYSYEVPTWGQTGVSGSYTSGNINTFGGSSTFSGVTTYTPTYGITGSQELSDSVTTFTRFIQLEAVDNMVFKNTNKIVQIWKTHLVSTGRSGDLREVFPYLVSAMMPYLGANTGKALQVITQQDDPFVLSVRPVAKP